MDGSASIFQAIFILRLCVRQNDRVFETVLIFRNFKLLVKFDVERNPIKTSRNQPSSIH